MIAVVRVEIVLELFDVAELTGRIIGSGEPERAGDDVEHAVVIDVADGASLVWADREPLLIKGDLAGEYRRGYEAD